MENMQDNPQPKSVSPIATILISLLIGGLAGGFVSTGILNQRGFVTSPGSATTTKQTLQVTESSAVIDVVKSASPAVVSIIVSKDYSKIYGNQGSSPFDYFNWMFGQQQQMPQGQQEVGGGSGFIVSADGLIMTNKHVVSDTQASYSVVMNDGKKYDAKVLSLDPSNDVAVLKIEATGLPILTFADSDAVQIGQSVIAIGNALGEYRNTVTQGIISGKARTITASDSSTGASETIENVFQTDAAINPGNSGGPLLDLSGHVIAINTAINSSGQSIGFAIPSNIVKQDMESVQQTGKISRPFLGVRYVVVTQVMADQNKLPINYGALIQAGEGTDATAVVSDSPADKAGLKENDIIAAVDGTKIDNNNTLSGLLASKKVGDTVTLTIYHEGKAKDVTVVLDQAK